VFAAELLMPEPAVRAAWGATSEIDAVAERFGISRLAAHWRLYGFGLVGERPA
jgi:Zn-dependent peptidase ImmA (M78 family)